jgi:GntR family transcriptional regulator
MQTEPMTGPASVLPLAGPMPLYYRLQQALNDRIAAGEWRPGQQIPTIRELGDTYRVSRITVVQALQNLAREGLLRRRQGKGVFVAEPKIEQGPVRLLSFTDDITRRGHRPESRTLSARREAASPELAARLNVTPGEPVLLLERLRLADGEPMGVQRAFLPERLVPGLVDTRRIQSLYRLLRDRYGLIPSWATETFEPVVVDRKTARLLGVTSGSPAFGVERITRDQANRTFEFVSSVMRGDRYKVLLKLVASMD